MIKGLDMHHIIASEIIKICRARSEEGDCPITPAESVERLEQCIIELANQIEILSADEPSIEAYKLFRKERRREGEYCKGFNIGLAAGRSAAIEEAAMLADPESAKRIRNLR